MTRRTQTNNEKLCRAINYTLSHQRTFMHVLISGCLELLTVKPNV